LTTISEKPSADGCYTIPKTPHTHIITTPLYTFAAEWYHAAFHSVCAVVGAGVLGLPYAFSYLGWVGGLLTLSTLCLFSIYTSYLLSQLHEVYGVRLNTYREIGEAVWGPRTGRWAVASVQYTLMIGLCITYSVTAGQSLKGIISGECSGSDCEFGVVPWIIVFGVVQLALSQVPDFHSLWWVSLLGAVMSIGYCAVAAGASLAVAVSGSSPPPMAPRSSANVVFGIMNALGSVAFTFGGQAVLPEIQATLKTPPRTTTSMMKSVGVAYIVVILAYFSVAVTGYAAYGTSVNPDVLLSISKPLALIDAANMMVVIHVAAGYQVFAMPLFDLIESSIRGRAKTVGKSPPRPVVLRLTMRSLFVFATTLIACLLPFFDDLMGLIASVGLMPVTFILPPLLWISSGNAGRLEAILCGVIALSSTLLALVAFVGSMRNIIVDATNYNIFG